MEAPPATAVTGQIPPRSSARHGPAIPKGLWGNPPITAALTGQIPPIWMFWMGEQGLEWCKWLESIQYGSGRRLTKESWRDRRERECCEGEVWDVPVEREDGWKLERSGGLGSQSRLGNAM